MNRFFLAHAKSCGDDEIAALTELATRTVTRFAKGQPFSVVPGRTFFEEAFKRCGSWPAWMDEAAGGIDPVSREPLFHAILVPAGPIGSGTAGIIERALMAEKPIFAFDGEARAAQVVEVRLVDLADWKTGWRVRVDRSLA